MKQNLYTTSCQNNTPHVTIETKVYLPTSQAVTRKTLKHVRCHHKQQVYVIRGSRESEHKQQLLKPCTIKDIGHGGQKLVRTPKEKYFNQEETGREEQPPMTFNPKITK